MKTSKDNMNTICAVFLLFSLNGPSKEYHATVLNKNRFKKLINTYMCLFDVEAKMLKRRCRE